MRVAGAVGFTIGAAGFASESQDRASSRRPDVEDTYTISATLQVLNPVNPADMNDDFQDVRVLEQDSDSCTLEVTYYPLFQPTVGENSHWLEEDANMTEYLRPTPSENWDQAMRRDLIGELHLAGIDPERLSDRQVVVQVSRWAMKRAKFTDAFAIWTIYYPDGKPAVYPPLREAFVAQRPDDTWTDQRMFEREALGRSMFYNKTHGACTSSSIYLATIFRALGIPARTVICIPPFDPNDEAQASLFYGNIHNNRIRETIRAALNGMSGFDDHMFNEVYVGHRWVRLNYSKLGQPILDAHYFGLLTHICTCSDMSQVPLAQTWGMRYFRYPSGQLRLSSSNPYRLIAVHDHFGANAQLDNPIVPVAELRTVTIIGLLRPDSAEIPKWITDTWRPERKKPDFLIAFKEWVPGTYLQMRAFRKKAGHDFVLTAPGEPDVIAHLGDSNFSSDDGTFQAYEVTIRPADRSKLSPGVAYGLRPINNDSIYRWQVAPDLPPLRLGD